MVKSEETKSTILEIEKVNQLDLQKNSKIQIDLKINQGLIALVFKWISLIYSRCEIMYNGK